MSTLPWPDHLDPALRDRLVAAYEEPHRGYHDLRHLTEVLERLEELMPPEHPGRDAVILAAWFNDAVYDDAGDNEERSARWAEEALDGPLAQEVARLVRLTQGHRPEPGDLNGGLLCDADLAILAADPRRYREYVAGVRQEYAAVPDGAFAHGRASVLRDLLAKDSLFSTDEARTRWEAKARANLEAELTDLE